MNVYEQVYLQDLSVTGDAQIGFFSSVCVSGDVECLFDVRYACNNFLCFGRNTEMILPHSIHYTEKASIHGYQWHSRNMVALKLFIFIFVGGSELAQKQLIRTGSHEVELHKL